MGFGMEVVIGNMRVPSPPARITAWNSEAEAESSASLDDRADSPRGGAEESIFIRNDDSRRTGIAASQAGLACARLENPQSSKRRQSLVGKDEFPARLRD